MKRAARRRILITGAAGQDGTYVARLCAARGDHVVGLSRRRASDEAFSEAHALDLTDGAAVRALVRDSTPDECYHFAAYHRSSHAVDVDEADEERMYLETNVVALQGLLASLRTHSPECRVLLAGSCHMFGHVASSPQNEETPMRPNSAYGITKVAALHLGRLYRERHRLFCAMAILYNHESELRGPAFVTSRLAQAAVDVRGGRASDVTVGNLDAEVDWGFAGDYARAMSLMLSAPVPNDYVVASGALHRVRDFARVAFARVGLDWQAHVRQDGSVHQPVASGVYHGDISRIRRDLGWSPTTSFEGLVHLMVDARAATDGASVR